MLGGNCLYWLGYLPDTASPFILLLFAYYFIHAINSSVLFIQFFSPGFTSHPMQSLVTVEQGEGRKRRKESTGGGSSEQEHSLGLVLHGHFQPL